MFCSGVLVPRGGAAFCDQGFAHPSMVKVSHGRVDAKSILYLAHPVPSRTIKIYDCSRDGAYIVMDNAVWNRLQTYAVPTPGPPKCMILGEMVLTLSWTMLFEIV